MGVRCLCSDVYLETDKKGKWQRDDYDGPGECGKKPTTNANADVVVVSYEKEKEIMMAQEKVVRSLQLFFFS